MLAKLGEMPQALIVLYFLSINIPRNWILIALQLKNSYSLLAQCRYLRRFQSEISFFKKFEDDFLAYLYASFMLHDALSYYVIVLPCTCLLFSLFSILSGEPAPLLVKFIIFLFLPPGDYFHWHRIRKLYLFRLPFLFGRIRISQLLRSHTQARYLPRATRYIFLFLYQNKTLIALIFFCKNIFFGRNSTNYATRDSKSYF